MRIHLKNENHLYEFDDDYDEYVKPINKKIKAILKDYNLDFYNQTKEDALNKIADGEKEYQDGLKQYQEGMDAYQNGMNQYLDGKKQYDQGYLQYQQGLKEYQSGLKQYQVGLSQYQTGYQKYQEGLKQYQAGYQTYLDYVEKVDQYDTSIQTVEAALSQFGGYEQAKNIPSDSPYYQQVQTLIVSYDQLKQNEPQIPTLKPQLPVIKQELDQNKTVLDQTNAQLVQSKQQLDASNQKIKASKALLDQTGIKLADSKKQLDEAKNTLDSNLPQLEEAKVKLDQAQSDLNDAKQQVADLQKGKIITLTKNESAAILSYSGNCDSISALSILFPVLFFLVAALVSMTTMTRMVEELRVQNGTLRALGYKKKDVIMQYLIYAFLATFFASSIGIVFGTYFFPSIIYYLYRIMMFDIGAPTRIIFELATCIQTYIISVVIILFVTFMVCYKELQAVPAQILRPKAPKLGKRILLERITFIWKRLSFNQKVTMRNIFRYKKRFLMTIIGIMGCTALIVTGFGIRDSIRAIMPDQYEKVFNYDLQINLKADLDKKQKQDFINSLTNDDKIEKLSETYMSSISAINENVEENVQIIVPNNNSDFNTLINLTDVKSKNNLSLPEDGVLLTDKAAQLLGVEAGDNITLKDTDENETNVKVTNVVENYGYHYIYMSKSMYENLYDKSFDSNVILTKDFNLDNETEDNFVKDLMNMPEVASVTRISTAMNMMNDTMKSLNYVVVILIVSAGLLAFVVLYNLSNVNISERIRELATIKVLGFYDKEVYLYITRETIILTAIGLVLGLVAGYFLDFFILETCEINMLRFRKFVAPLSFVFAALITILFTIIVNIVTYFALKKINMIESLKSVE